MLAPTHGLFGVFMSLIVLSLFGVKMGLHWTILLAAVIGAILPDIDHVKSYIGRLFYFISHPIEQRFGHRMVTHSIIGWVIATIASAGIVIGLYYAGISVWASGLYNWRWVAAFSSGYFSHLMLDLLNARGVPLFWPEKLRFVMFKSQSARFESGGKYEVLISLIIIICIFLALPLTKYGLNSSLHWILATSGSAIEEYKSSDKVSMVEFEGYFTRTKQPIDKGLAEILDVENKRLIVLIDGSVFTLSDEISADIMASKIRVKQTDEPLKIEKKEFKEKNKEYLLTQVPDNALLSGTVYLPESLKLTLPNFSGGFERLKQNGNELVLDFADKKMIEALDFTEQFKLEQEKDEAELKKLYQGRANAYKRIEQLSRTDGLTPLGRELLLSREKREEVQLKISDLQGDINEFDLRIKEVELRKATRRPIFSGSVFIRY